MTGQFSARPKGTVLVADDDPSVRETIAEILGMAGYEVLQAADGDEALGVLHQHIDALILDLYMPNRDGLTVLEALGPPPPWVIVLSAFAYYTPQNLDDMGLGRKVTRALRKPVPPKQLLAAVAEAVD